MNTVKNSAVNRARLSRSVTKPNWKDLEQTVTHPQLSLKQATSMLSSSQYPRALANSSLANTVTHGTNGRQSRGSNIHQRLFEEHKSHQQRRSSIYDPERKDKEEQMQKCTFQPCLDKTQYTRLGYQYNPRDSMTSTSYPDYDLENGGANVSSLKKRCRS